MPLHEMHVYMHGAWLGKAHEIVEYMHMHLHKRLAMHGCKQPQCA